MVLDKHGESLKIDDKVFTVGGKVLANNSSEYEGLSGEVLEIRTDPDKDTENEGVDIHVCFEVPEENEDFIKTIESRFSELYRQPKTIDEIPLDLVVMAPEELDIVED